MCRTCCVFLPFFAFVIFRCIIKASTDYAERRFPSVACILDFNRCSITFKSVSKLNEGVERFCRMIKGGECGCVTAVIRIKNGFKEINEWKSLDEYGYRDLKLNLLITDGNISVVGEVQILLDWMLRAKKMYV